MHSLDLYVSRGRVIEGERVLSFALDLARKIEDDRAAAMLLTYYAQLEKSRGGLAEAEEMAEQALACCENDSFLVPFKAPPIPVCLIDSGTKAAGHSTRI